MGLSSVAARNRSLDNNYGPTAGPYAAASFDVLLYVGDPTTGGVETSGPGYAAASQAQSNWSAAAFSAKESIDLILWPAPTGEWTGPITHAVLRDHDTGDLWDACRIVPPIDITGASPNQPAATLRVYHPEASET